MIEKIYLNARRKVLCCADTGISHISQRYYDFQVETLFYKKY